MLSLYVAYNAATLSDGARVRPRREETDVTRASAAPVRMESSAMCGTRELPTLVGPAR